MTTFAFATVLVRILGLLIISIHLPQLFEVGSLAHELFGQNGSNVESVLVLLISLTPLGLGVFLWFRSDIVAERISLSAELPSFNPAAAPAQGSVPNDRAGAGPDRYSGLQQIAFSIIGVWILADVIPDALNALLEAMSGGGRSQDLSSRFGDFLTGRTHTSVPLIVARLILGLTLFLNSDGIAALWKRVKRTPISAAVKGE